MKNTLARISFLLVLLTVSRLRAEPTEPCARAEYLANEVADGLAIIDELIEMARPVCAEKALARDCARQRIEIRARITEVKQLEAMQRKAALQCKAGTATRKAHEARKSVPPLPR